MAHNCWKDIVMNMGQISKRKKQIRTLDDIEEEPIAYCPQCLEYGFHGVLRERVYVVGEIANPIDRENFRQCHDCGTIVPIYEVKKVNYKISSRYHITHLIQKILLQD